MTYKLTDLTNISYKYQLISQKQKNNLPIFRMPCNYQQLLILVFVVIFLMIDYVVNTPCTQGICLPCCSPFYDPITPIVAIYLLNVEIPNAYIVPENVRSITEGKCFLQEIMRNLPPMSANLESATCVRNFK